MIVSGLFFYLCKSLYSKNVKYFNEDIAGFICSKPQVKTFLGRKQSAGNQRLIKNNLGIRTFISLVGTSETTRVTTNLDEPDTRFYEWLAGVIDGDGCFLISKKGYASLEITMGLEDLPLLRYIQNKLGGSVKQRSGAKAYRYRLHTREGVLGVLCKVNGNIRNSVRILQLHRLCQHFGIPVQEPTKLTIKNYWFAGFFDADGSIGLTYKDKERVSLRVRVVNKYLVDVKMYKEIFGGTIHYNGASNGSYHWTAEAREDLLTILPYFKGKCRSYKSRRFFLMDEYFTLRDLKAFKKPSEYHKAWEAFLKKWN